MNPQRSRRHALRAAPTKRPVIRAAARALIAGVLAVSGVAHAQVLSDAQLRARFLVNFLRFTQWPDTASASAPLTVCVLGLDDPFAGALAEIQGALVAGRRVVVREHLGPEQAATCSLLYVPDAELRRLADAREAIGRRSVLVVGESEAVLDRGGMIALRSVDRHLAFVVKIAPARRAALEFAPQMLHAAAEVMP